MNSSPLRDRLEQKKQEQAQRPAEWNPSSIPSAPALDLDDEPNVEDLAPEHAAGNADESDAQDAPPTRSGLAIVREMFETVVFVLLVFFIVRGLIQNFRIEGQSMFPTMHDQQYILVNKAVYLHFDLNAPLRLLPGRGELPPKVVYPFHPPQRGDVVVFIAPESASSVNQEQKDYIKRVIATEGETVTVTEGKVYVDGELLDESAYLPENTVTSCRSQRSQCITTVPPGHIYVMGDNRANSSDSREWDSLPLENVIGKAWVSYYPREHWGVISSPSYAID